MKKITKIAGLLAGLALAGSLFTSCFTDSEYDDSLVAQTTIEILPSGAGAASFAEALAGTVTDKIDGSNLLSITAAPTHYSSLTEEIQTLVQAATIGSTSVQSTKAWATNTVDLTSVTEYTADTDQNIIYVTYKLTAEADCTISSIEAYAGCNKTSTSEIVVKYKVNDGAETVFAGTSADGAGNKEKHFTGTASLDLSAGDVVEVTIYYNDTGSSSFVIAGSGRKVAIFDVTIVADERS